MCLLFIFELGEQKKQGETELLTVIIKQIQKNPREVCKTQQKQGKKWNNPPKGNTRAAVSIALDRVFTLYGLTSGY